MSRQEVENSPSERGNAETRAITQKVESLTELLLDCLNERNFDPGSPVYKHFSPSFRVEAGFISATDLDLTSYLKLFEDVTKNWPNWRSTIVDATSYVDGKAGLAEVYHNVQTSGRPPGITRTSVNIALFRRVRGKWRMERLRGVRGLVDPNSNEGRLTASWMASGS